MRTARGYTLVEALVVLALVGITAALVMPDLFQVRRTTDFIRLSRQIAADALRCKMEALVSCRHVGLVFCEVEDRPYYVMVADGDADGVSRSDFNRGVDRPLGPKVWVHFMSGGTRLGVPSAWRVPDPSGGGTLDERGLRLGSSGIMSFANTGGATPSSVYFNDGRERVLAIRVHGALGRVRALMWKRGWTQWQEIRL